MGTGIFVTESHIASEPREPEQSHISISEITGIVNVKDEVCLSSIKITSHLVSQAHIYLIILYLETAYRLETKTSRWQKEQ
jgi:hypothetical protein